MYNKIYLSVNLEKSKKFRKCNIWMCPYISVVFQKLIVVANVIDTLMLIF